MWRASRWLDCLKASLGAFRQASAQISHFSPPITGGGAGLVERLHAQEAESRIQGLTVDPNGTPGKSVPGSPHVEARGHGDICTGSNDGDPEVLAAVLSRKYIHEQVVGSQAPGQQYRSKIRVLVRAGMEREWIEQGL